MTKVIIADDEPEVRKVLSEIMREAGFETHETFDGLGALMDTKDMRPDLLLLDWMIPELSGNEVLKALRNDEAYADVQNTKVIVVSDFDDEASRRTFLHEGANDFVPKSDDSDVLRENLLTAVKALGVKP